MPTIWFPYGVGPHPDDEPKKGDFHDQMPKRPSHQVIREDARARAEEKRARDARLGRTVFKGFRKF